MRTALSPLRLVVLGTLLVALGCAHTAVDPFIAAPQTMNRLKGAPPPCFAAPLADCVGVAPAGVPQRGIASPWRYPFQPDLHHRICRGDTQARLRFLDGARRVAEDDAAGIAEQIYLEFLDGCSSPGFCSWALGVAGDEEESVRVRQLLLEGARRGCERVLGIKRLSNVAAELGRSLADEPRWVTSSRDLVCADLERPGEPWQDLVALHQAGCLDLTEWIELHHDDRDGLAAALERCVDGREIRYREADCLRELAGLDHQIAVDWLRGRDRRGWGMSSNVTRYARALLRFPEEGQLESELTRHGLIRGGAPETGQGLQAAVLPEEILERHGRLLRFSPSCALRYCEHAPLAYQLADLASPALDDLIIEERWPALGEVELGAGPRAVSTSIRGIPLTFHVADRDDGSAFDAEHLDRLEAGVAAALDEPHELIIYGRGRVYRLPIRFLGEWFDLEAVLGGLNAILAERKSELRLATLDPHCIPCARVVAGPGDGLIAAALDGLIEVVDPFKELWVLPNFEPGLLTGMQPALDPVRDSGAPAE